MPGFTGASPYAYCLLRLVPDLARGEALNVGIVLFCRQQRFLGVRTVVDPARLAALPAMSADASVARIVAHLTGLARVAEGDRTAGPITRLDASDRFGWLAAPASTIVQPSSVHTGLCDDAAATLAALFATLVAVG